MCDRENFRRLEDKVDGLSANVGAYHAATDEKLRTLFKSEEQLYLSLDRLSASATSLVRILIASLVFIVTVTVFALVYGALGGDGFNAVARAAAANEAAK